MTIKLIRNGQVIVECHTNPLACYVDLRAYSEYWREEGCPDGMMEQFEEAAMIDELCGVEDDPASFAREWLEEFASMYELEITHEPEGNDIQDRGGE